MALVLADRVKETTTTTGTGTVTLAGASTGYQSFAVVGNGNTTYYTIAGQTGSEWEVGIGTYTSSGTTLSRTTVLASSAGGSLVTFSAGTKDVFVTYPAGRSIYADGAVLTATNSAVLPAANGGTGLSSPGASGNILTSDGTVWLSSAPAGGSYSRTTFTATAGQTAFTVTYAVGYLQIYVNGVLLTGSDYTASSGTGFTLNVACAAGDIVEALVITASISGGGGITTGKSIAMAMIFGY
jgi:hypothetical protein